MAVTVQILKLAANSAGETMDAVVTAMPYAVQTTRAVARPGRTVTPTVINVNTCIIRLLYQ